MGVHIRVPGADPLGGYIAFIPNQIEVTAPLPFELAPECFLVRADSAQVEMIKQKLQEVVAPALLPQCYSRYEAVTTIVDGDNGSQQIITQPLPRDEWRYYVVTSPNGVKNFSLHYVLNASEVPLDLIALHFMGVNGESGNGYRSLSLLNYYQGVGAPAMRVQEAQLLEIPKLYSRWEQVAQREPGGLARVQQASEMFDAVRLLPHSSNFRVLGLFSIIELLISHNPTLEDKGDSITRQMKTKMPLLMRRFDRKVDYKSYFKIDSADKIWGQLYGYRSAVAHGGKADFTNNQKQGHLISAANANNFLEVVVRAVIRNYLYEPDLYDDIAAV